MNNGSKAMMNEFSRNRIPYSIDEKGNILSPASSSPDFIFRVTDENVVFVKFIYSEMECRMMQLSIEESVKLAKVRHKFVAEPSVNLREEIDE